MEDPVAVFGLSDVTVQPWGPERSTHIPIPGTTCHIYEVSAPPDNCRNACSVILQSDWPETSTRVVMSSMVVERTRLIKMIDRCTKTLVRYSTNTIQYATIEPLWKWKAQLVFERLRRNRSARTIQKQFRECMGNPAYDMCRRRLLREFAEGIQI
jgi:hypothetical protein